MTVGVCLCVFLKMNGGIGVLAGRSNDGSAGRYSE